MTTKIGGIVVDIDARLTKMEAALAKADRDLGQFQRRVANQGSLIQRSLAGIDSGFASMGNSIKGFVAGFGVMELVKFGHQILTFADDLSAAADQAGMGVERYQTLTEALRTLEVDGAKAEKAFKTLQATLGEVQSGADNSATKALENLGITARIMNGEIDTSDELLDALAAASKTAGSEAQFTADMVDIFGKKVGVDMANALSDGGVALHELEAGFLATGKVIDEEMINKLADANEAVDRFTTQTRNQFVIWAAGAIESLQGVAAWVDRVQHRLAQMSPLGDPSKFGHINAAWERENIDKLVQAQRWKVVEGRANLSQRVGSRMSDAAIKVASDDLTRQANELERLTGILNSVQEPRTSTGAGSSPGFTARPSASSGGRGSRRSSSARTAKPELTAAEQRANAAIQDAEWFTTDLLKADFTPLMRELGMLDGMVVDLGSSITELPDISKILPVEEQERIERFAEDFAATFSGAFEEAIFSGDLDGALDGLLEDMGKMVLRLMIIEPLARNIATIMKSMSAGGGLLSFLGVGGGTTLAQDVSSMIAANPGTFASGGRPGVGKWAWVGEEGPELMKFDQPGTIIPNHRLHEVNSALGSEGGGAPIVVNQNYSFSGVAVTQQEFMQGLTLTKADTIRTFRDLRSRGSI
jgi:hypothetical protein